MSALELRKEMLELIKNEDESSLNSLYKLIKAYKKQRDLDKMILEGEADIDANNLHSQAEVQKMIENWTK